MTPLLAATLEHLGVLVGFDTRNPPRKIDTNGIFGYLSAQLRDFELRLMDHGAGAVSLLAVRGTPRLLFNVHLDTVPDGGCWTRCPLELHVTSDRAIGLGACDIKGAAAGLLAAAECTEGSAAILFSTDEEANDSRCIAGLLQTGARYEAVLVAEPTGARAVLAHRGISSVRIRFTGQAGHASDSRTLGNSALHQAVRWGERALQYAAEQEGLRFNIGRIEGGIKSNVVAPAAEVHVGFRPLPFADSDTVLNALWQCAEPAPTEFEETFRGIALPANAAQYRAAQELASSLSLPAGATVDFWTEAALFSAAGWPAIVYGPGDIAQAHAADEWVALDQLSVYAESIYRMINDGLA